ncbi:MAG: alpha/beta fold hydrolase [Armatimonadetes bacterium]|nr:alpha/beta fold hydrolase [Armatimonadota bacterium]
MQWLKVASLLSVFGVTSASGADDGARETFIAAGRHMADRRFAEAREAYRAVTEMPDAPASLKAESWLRIGQCFVRQNRRGAEAAEAFRKAAGIGLADPERSSMKLSAAEGLFVLGECAEARALAAGVLEGTGAAAPFRERAQVLIGRSYYREENHAAARAVFQQILEAPGRGIEAERAAMRHLGMLRGAEVVTMETRLYPSSLDPNLVLSAEFHVPPEPRPLCLFFHGWHGSARASRVEMEIGPLLGEFFLVNVDMRGRGTSTGKPDASGFELIDGLDGLEFARQTWPDRIQAEGGVYLVGGSGGGGNTLALAGKAPDIFSAAVSWAGISDYARQYRHDASGRIRDEMEVWIGGNPDTNPEGYATRSGLHVLENVLTQLFVCHGTRDATVPMPQAYRERAEALGRTNIRFRFNELGHDSIEWVPALAHLRANRAIPSLSPKGSLVVSSFLACRSFWLVLDDPARMGRADYELDDRGALYALRFTQDAGRTPVASARLRVFGEGATVEATGGGEKPAVERIRDAPGYADFLIKGGAPWKVKVTHWPARAAGRN